MLSIKKMHETKPARKPAPIVVGAKAKNANPLIEAMLTKSAEGLTENGAKTYTNTGSHLVDFLAQAGATRKNPDRGLELFEKAYSEDSLMAVRLLFYMRDIRGGQGERALFQNCLTFLGTQYKDVFEKIVCHVPEYGRWDDIFFDNEVCMDMIAKQLRSDVESDHPSLLAKWLPTINASSARTRAKAATIAAAIGMSAIEYRKAVRDVRKKLATVEEKMSAKKWEDIDYSRIPSRAGMIYRNAFFKHDEVRYKSFVEAAKKGEVKINSGVLYPYEIFTRLVDRHGTVHEDPTMDALWSQLPDYTAGRNAIVVADTSGSMTSVSQHGVAPIAVSVSLALYFAEKNDGPFKDHFITFSNKPKLQKVVGDTLAKRMRSIITGEVSNTDLQAVFDLILSTAMKHGVSEENLPGTIYIISDMEFDNPNTFGRVSTNFETIRAKYKVCGYKMPNIVFWNVDSRNNNTPVRMNEHNVALVSGCSPSIFRQVTENKTPYELMLDIVESERYARISF